MNRNGPEFALLKFLGGAEHHVPTWLTALVLLSKTIRKIVLITTVSRLLAGAIKQSAVFLDISLDSTCKRSR